MKTKITLILLLILAFSKLQGQHFIKPGDGIRTKSFYHPQGLDLYLNETDPEGNIYHLYYDTVTSGFNYGREFAKIRLQIFDGKSWLFSKPVYLFSNNDVIAPRIMDLQWYNNALYICGSFDSSSNNSGGGILKFENRQWQTVSAGLSKLNNLPYLVNKLYAFNQQLLATGDFDSIPGTPCKGMLLLNNGTWSVVGNNTAMNGFNGTSNYNSNYFEAVNDTLYVYKKNNIGDDTITIGGKKIYRIGRFHNGDFEQVPPVQGRISHLLSYNGLTAAIELSPLFYARYLTVKTGNNWTRHQLPDSFYSTNFITGSNTGNQLYFAVQNSNQLTIDIYKFNGSAVSKLKPWQIAGSYIPLSTSKTIDGIVMCGNFQKTNTANFNDSCRYISALVFTPSTIISGYTFMDNNADGIKQSNEPVLPFCTVSINGKTAHTLSDSRGHYTFHLPTGSSYTISAYSSNGYTVSSSVNIASGKDSIYNTNLPMVSENKNDIGITLYSTTGRKARQGFVVQYKIEIQNTDNNASNVSVRVGMPKGYTSLLPKNYSVQGQTPTSFTFNTTLSPHSLSTYDFSCVYGVDSFALGQKITLSATLQQNDNFNANNTDTLVQTVTSAYDPNIKTASPSEIVSNNRRVNYIIYYQNEGNDTAINVTILDTLAPDTDLKSIRINTSKGFSVENNILIWRLENIMLPPKEASFQKSSGYVSFTINLSEEAKVGDTVFNKAAIYFDYQKPVITNSATVVFKKVNSLFKPQKIKLFSIYPNPSNGQFSYKNPGGLTGYLQLTDINGRSILNIPIDEEGVVVLPASVVTGVYFLRHSDTGEIIGKLMITR